jgi:branched-chain amino acid transport system substrate-binding protein
MVSASPAFAFQSEGTVRIGSLEAQTGVPAPYGIQALVGSQIAVDEINAAGGVTVDGRKVKLAITPGPNGYDPGGDSAATIALIKKLVSDDQVLVIKGTSRSDNTEAAFNYLNELEKQGAAIALLSPSSASPTLGKITKWGFRNAFFESQIHTRVMDLMKGLGYKTVGTYVAKDNGFNAAVAKGMIMPTLEKEGFQVVVQTDGLEKDTDYSSQVEALRKANPDIVVISTPVLPGIGLMKEAVRRGFNPKAWVGTIGNIAPEIPKIGGKAVEHMVVGSSYSPDQPGVQKLAAEYKKRTNNELNLFGVNGYEAIYLFKAAIESSGIKNTKETINEDRAKFRDALAKTEIASVTGEKVKFDEHGDAIKKGFLLTIKGGAYRLWDEKPFK